MGNDINWAERPPPPHHCPIPPDAVVWKIPVVVVVDVVGVSVCYVSQPGKDRKLREK